MKPGAIMAIVAALAAVGLTGLAERHFMQAKGRCSMQRRELCISYRHKEQQTRDWVIAHQAGHLVSGAGFYAHNPAGKRVFFQPSGRPDTLSNPELFDKILVLRRVCHEAVLPVVFCSDWVSLYNVGNDCVSLSSLAFARQGACGTWGSHLFINMSPSYWFSTDATFKYPKRVSFADVKSLHPGITHIYVQTPKATGGFEHINMNVYKK